MQYMTALRTAKSAFLNRLLVSLDSSSGPLLSIQLLTPHRNGESIHEGLHKPIARLRNFADTETRRANR